jgi:hypothetical protein
VNLFVLFEDANEIGDPQCPAIRNDRPTARTLPARTPPAKFRRQPADA